jgi:hypothetical protein
MAVIGDVLVKLVADFAEFSKGMQESTKQLDDFGKRANSMLDSIAGVGRFATVAGAVALIGKAVTAVIDEIERLQTKFTDVGQQADKLGVSFERFEQLRIDSMQAGLGVDKLAETMARLQTITQQALLGNAATIDSLNRLGVTILDNTGKLRSQEDINKRVADAFNRMPPGIEKTRLQLQLLGQTGEQTDKALKELSTSSADFQQHADAMRVAQATAQLKQLEDRAAAAKEKFDLLVAATTMPTKAGFLEGWATGMERLNAAIVANDYTKLQNILRLLFSPGEQLKLGATILGSADPIGEKITELEGKLKGYQDRLASTQQPGAAGWWARQANDVDTLNKNIANTLTEIGRLKSTQTDRYPSESGYTVPTPDKPGSNPPKATGGGGGGRSDADDVQALIDRYTKMTKAAQDSAAAVRANTRVDIDDLALIVQARQETQDILARIEQHRTVSPEQKKALEDAVLAAKEQQQATARSIQYATQADATQRRLGDGTQAYGRMLRDLNRQLDSGRLEFVAYTRALKEQTEEVENAALAARRYDDDLGSLAAGFELAARQYARTNDLFSLGTQTFNAFTNAMGEELDVLLGKSNKTFGQIAADFAQMLAKMALQAATSAVFNSVFGGATGMAGAGMPGSPYFGPVNPNAGAGFFGWLGSVFGGGRATGGDVQPNVAYTVGEAGPERFVPTVAGRVEPRSRDAGGTVNVNLDMGHTTGTTDPGAALEFGRRVRAAVVDVIQQEKRPGGTLYSRANA